MKTPKQLTADESKAVKDLGLGATVTEDELRAEVEKAKHFSPALAHWILATTAPKDAAIEKLRQGCRVQVMAPAERRERGRDGAPAEGQGAL